MAKYLFYMYMAIQNCTIIIIYQSSSKLVLDNE